MYCTGTVYEMMSYRCQLKNFLFFSSGVTYLFIVNYIIKNKQISVKLNILTTTIIQKSYQITEETNVF